MKNTPTSRDKLLDATFDHVYRYGYHGASTAAILKQAGVPKGSMYHHFTSKKSMVLAMIAERLVPKMELFFDFSSPKDGTAIEILHHTMRTMSSNIPLITHGCPLHRLMLEMAALDDDIVGACQEEYDRLSTNLGNLLQRGMTAGEVRKDEPFSLAQHMILSTWGFLSRPPKESSAKAFLDNANRLVESIQAV